MILSRGAGRFILRLDVGVDISLRSFGSRAPFSRSMFGSSETTGSEDKFSSTSESHWTSLLANLDLAIGSSLFTRLPKAFPPPIVITRLLGVGSLTKPLWSAPPVGETSS
jgi:hypothetical protein